MSRKTVAKNLPSNSERTAETTREKTVRIKGQARFTVRRGLIVNLVMLAIIIVILFVTLSIGRQKLTIGEILAALVGRGSNRANLLIFSLRLPRVALGIVVGLGMGISGCIMQSLLRNPMASPGTLGISSGSGLFMMLFMLLFFQDADKYYLMPIFAMAGGLVSAAIIFLLSIRKNRAVSPTVMIMNGVAIGGAYGAATLFISLMLDSTKIEFAQRWQAGDLWGTDWKYILLLTCVNSVLIIYAFYKSRTLNAMMLGRPTATGIGVPYGKEFMGLAVCAVFLASMSVAYGGNFFFVGMIGPHIARKLVGNNHKVLLPASGLAAAIIVILGDVLARNIGFLVNIPTGIVISVISTPYFLYLLMKS